MHSLLLPPPRKRARDDEEDFLTNIVGAEPAPLLPETPQPQPDQPAIAPEHALLRLGCNEFNVQYER